MDPSVDQLNAMNTLDDAWLWIGANGRLREAVDRTMGELRHFREVVGCPEPVWSAALAQLRVITIEARPEVVQVGALGAANYVAPSPEIQQVERPPNVLEASQVGALRRISRLRLNRPAEEEAPAAQGRVSTSAPPQAQPGLVVKSQAAGLISEVIDQADHTEVAPWRPERVSDAMAVYDASNKGVRCAEENEPTPLMFAALEYKLLVIGSPFACFGVWRQNGGRLEKKQRLTIHAKNQKGEWVPYEIAGPSNLMEWKKGWKVFCVAMRAMNMADQPTLDAYEALLEELVGEWGPECFWIIAQGDGRMRSEKMVRLHRDLRKDYEAAVLAGTPTTSPYEPKRPWNHVFLMAARDDKFWQREVRDKCLRYTTRTQTKEQVQDDGFGVVLPANTGLDVGGRGGGGGSARGVKRKVHASSSSSDSPPPEA